MAKVLDLVGKELTRDGWELTWQSNGPRGHYRDTGLLEVLISKRNVCLRFRTPVLRGDGKRRRHCKTLGAATPQKVDESFAEQVREQLARVETLVDDHLRGHGEA